jgi:hypothetical protein
MSGQGNKVCHEEVMIDMNLKKHLGIVWMDILLESAGQL